MSESVVAVTLPEGVRGGMKITVEAPDGRSVDFRLPNGVKPGQRVQVNVGRAGR